MWISILVVVVGIAAATAAAWLQYWVLDSSGDGVDFRITIRYKAYLKMTKLWLALGIIGAIAFTIIALLLLFLRKRIQVSRLLRSSDTTEWAKKRLLSHS